MIDAKPTHLNPNNQTSLPSTTNNARKKPRLPLTSLFLNLKQRREIQENNQSIIDSIKNTLGEDVEKAFKEKFASHIFWSKPLPKDYMKIFFENTTLDHTLSLDNIISDSEKYPDDAPLNFGKEMGYTTTYRLAKMIKEKYGAAIANDFAQTILQDQWKPLTAGLIRQFVTNVTAKGEAPKEVEDFFGQELNDIFNKNKGIKTPHSWNESLTIPSENRANLNEPKISGDFFRDLNRASYFIKLLDEEPKALYQHPENPLDEDAVSAAKKTAVQRFIDFVGNKDQAFEISKVATQGVLSIPMIKSLEEDMPSPYKPKAQGVFTSGKDKLTYIFSLDDKRNVLVHFKSESTPKIFQVKENPESPPISPTTISLAEGSFFNYSYDTTLSFDNANKLNMVPTNINYDVKIEAGIAHDGL